MSTDNLDGRFTLKGPLRCAGVGSLVCAEDKDGARTAIRMIPQLAQGQEAVAAALRMPLHPVLPRALGSGAQNGSSWVAIDFPEGELLTNRLPLTTPALLSMGSMIAGALATLHQNEIIHGELSADSVLAVTAEGKDRFVLFDAPLVVINRLTDRRGEERLLAQLTALVPFLSPERARGGEASQAADVWALGMIISLASGAKGVPGGSTLERIAMIVSNKWRPAVSGLLPIALRLLLTRMLAPEAADRPSSREVASELEHLCVALNPPAVSPHAPPAIETVPMTQSKIEPLVEQTKLLDPFEAMVAQGVSAIGPDANAEPTRRMGIALTADLQHRGAEVTDPYALAVPTAPAGPPKWSEPKAPPAGEVSAANAPSVVVPIPLLIPAHPSQQAPRRAPLPLPPILDPAAISVPPQAARQPGQLPVMGATPEVAPAQFGKTQIFGLAAASEKPVAPNRTVIFGAAAPLRPEDVNTEVTAPTVPAGKTDEGSRDQVRRSGLPPTTEEVAKTSLYGAPAVPGASGGRAAVHTQLFGATASGGSVPSGPQPASSFAVVTEDVSTEAAAAVAQQQASPAATESGRGMMSKSFLSAPSPHDQAEEAFAAAVRKTQQRRFLALGIGAGVIVLLIGGLIFSSMGGSSDQPPAPRQPTSEEAAQQRADTVKAVKAAAAAKAAAAKAEPGETARSEPVNAEPVSAGAAKAEPIKAETAKAAPAKAEPAKAETAKAAPAKAEPVKAETAKAAPVKAEPVKTETAPVKAKPVVARAPAEAAPKAAPARAPKPVRTPVEEAPRRPASRLDEGD